MGKSDTRKREIIAFLRENPGVSSVQIGNTLKLSRIAIYNYLKKLELEGIITSYGNGKNTRYELIKKVSIPFDIKNVEQRVKETLDEFYEGLEEIDVAFEIEKLLFVILPNGESLLGYEALYEILKRERNGNDITEEIFSQGLIDFLTMYIDEDRKRRKNGFFDGTTSLRNIMQEHSTPVYIDKLYFSELSRISRFGRLRTASELSLGKLKNNKVLLENAVQGSIDRIRTFLLRENPDAIIFTPPTLRRDVQFRDVLRDEIIVSTKNIYTVIVVDKIKSTSKEFQPQKELSGYARIINANESVVVGSPPNITKLEKIIIFDDNFTTGATMNAIAGKVRSQGFTGKIIAITLTGNFDYQPGVTDEGDV